MRADDDETDRGLTNAASSGCMSTFSSAPPACSANCAVTISARSMLARSISRYFSEPALPSQRFSISPLVPEIICKRLFSSLVALEIDSLGMDALEAGVDLLSGFIQLKREHAECLSPGSFGKIGPIRAKSAQSAKIDNRVLS